MAIYSYVRVLIKATKILKGQILPKHVKTSSFETKKLSMFRQFQYFHQYKSQNLEIKISGLNQKTLLRFFENGDSNTSSYWGFHQKLGESGGKWFFFGLEVFNL